MSGSGDRVGGRGERGVAIVITALVVLALLVATAIVVELGNARSEKRSLQNAADAAALAGAAALTGDPVDPGSTAQAEACNEALAYVLTNLSLGGSATTGCSTTTVRGNTINITYPYDGGTGYSQWQKVYVSICRDVDTTFARAIDVTSVRICAKATARKTGSSESDPGNGGNEGCDSTKSTKDKKDDCTPDPGDDCDSTKSTKDKKDDCGTTPGTTEQPRTSDFRGAVCSGTPVVDGRVQAGEGYTSIGTLVGSAGTVFGTIYASCDANAFYLALVLNGINSGGTDHVANENVYGDATAYHAKYETGWSKHSYKDLSGSDRARFQISCSSTPVVDFMQDYLEEFKNGTVNDYRSSAYSGEGRLYAAGPTASSSSLVFNLRNPAITGWPVDKALVQSPDLSTRYPNTFVSNAGWEWNVIYEFSVDKSILWDSGSCGNPDAAGGPPITLGVIPFDGSSAKGGIHSSPAKVTEAGSLFPSNPGGVALVE